MVYVVVIIGIVMLIACYVKDRRKMNRYNNGLPIRTDDVHTHDLKKPVDVRYHNYLVNNRIRKRQRSS